VNSNRDWAQSEAGHKSSLRPICPKLLALLARSTVSIVNPIIKLFMYWVWLLMEFG
jgi:hypothetical protein